MHITTEELAKGLFVICDGGSRNNQSPERIGYGSFTVCKNGDAQPSTYDNKVQMVHCFEYGVGVTNSVAEVQTMHHALLYVKKLIGRGWKDAVRIGSDSQNALLAATTKIKKPAPHLKDLYVEVHNIALELRDQVQFVKLHEQDVKRILGH
jgi:ribonuclease HI